MACSEKELQYAARWRTKHPDRVKASRQKQIAKGAQSAARRWAQKHPEKTREYQRNFRLGSGATAAFNRLVCEQRGVCACCGNKPNPSAKQRNQRSLHLDHNHETG